MNLSAVLKQAFEQRATDVHIEPSLNLVFRVNGTLKRQAAIFSPEAVKAMAEQLLNDVEWRDFESRGSLDCARVIARVNCRLSIFKTDRGVGISLRLLSGLTNTIRTCNLHPQLAKLLENESGLILFTGPTGSGKSTTLAAMLEEINISSNRHIITLESPIEYRVQPKKSLIRQREVGVHTPSFEQGLLDCLREDPDVIVVGEMREAETMRLTLSAAETGHLVLATLHASNSADAVYRMMMSFAPERQGTVLSQLGDSILAIISQRMSYRADEDVMVPVLEILMGTHAVKNAIRKGEAPKLISLLQTGGADGSYTFERYQAWLDSKTDWARPEPALELSPEESEFPVKEPSPRPYLGAPRVVPVRSAPPPREQRPGIRTQASAVGSGTKLTKVHKDGRIEIPEMDLDLNDLAKSIQVRGEEESGSDEEV
ncbi:MAG: PilT/PilU family type 4a pilus ATPase [Bdellovibrionota bacterium]